MDDFSQGVITDASEFGAVDNPALGGYTEPNWNVGKWGADIASTEEQGIALPESVLRQYGNPNHPEFQKSFNQNYQVDLLNPQTGETAASDVPLKDFGPGRHTGKGIDLMYATARSMGFPVNEPGQVGFRITPRAEPVEQSENVPRGTYVGFPPPSWQDVENSQEFQGSTQEQKIQVLDAWHKQVYGYADRLGGFDEDARGNLYDFYNQQRQALAKPPDIVGQAEKSAEIAATQADTGVAQAQLHAASNLPPPIDTSTITDPQQRQEAERLNQWIAQQDQFRYGQQAKAGEQRLAEQQKALEGMGPPNEVARTVGGILPAIPTAMMGPASVPMFASQFGAQTYEQALQEARAEIQANHSHWSKEQQDIIANEVANRASQYATTSAIALGAAGVRLPIQSFILRAMASAGLGAAATGAAAGVAQMGENQAMQTLQPERNIMQGVPETVAKVATIGGIAGGLHGGFARPERPGPNLPERPAPQPEPVRPVRPEEITGDTIRAHQEPIPDVVQQGNRIVPGVHETKVPGPISEADLYRQEASIPQTPTRAVDLQSVGQNLSPLSQHILSSVSPDIHIVQGDANSWDAGNRTITLQDPRDTTTLMHEAVHAVMQDHGNDPAVIEAFRNFKAQVPHISNLPVEYHYALQSPEEHVAAAMSHPGYQKLIGKKGMQDITNAVTNVLNLPKEASPEIRQIIEQPIQNAARGPQRVKELEQKLGIQPGQSASTMGGEPAKPAMMPTEGVSGVPPQVLSLGPDAVSRFLRLPPEDKEQYLKHLENVNRSYESTKQHALSLQPGAPGNVSELPAKGAWKPSLDILHDYEGTRDLWSRTQNWNALRGLRQGEVNKVEDLYKGLLKNNKQLPSRIDDIGKMYMQGRPVQPAPDEAQFIQAAGNLLTQQYQQAAGMGVKITPPKFPGMMRRDYLETLLGRLGNANRLTQKAEELFLTGQNNRQWQTRLEFLRFADQYRKVYANVYQGLRSSPLDTPVNAPDWMKTYSADAVMQMLRNNAEALARNEAFGPKAYPERESFQKATLAISGDPSRNIPGDRTLNQVQRDNIQAAIQHVKQAVEGTLPIPKGFGRAAKSATTLSMASGPMTAFGRILPSELLRTYGQYGPFREGASILKSLNPQTWQQTHDWLRSMDLPMQARRGMLNDLYSNQAPWQSGKVMRAGMWLHSAVQNFGRQVAALSARTQLEKDLIPALQAGPTSGGFEFAQKEIGRRGLNPQSFATPNVSQEIKDAYVRNTVLDTQTSFDPLKSPMWGSNSSLGQYAMQFGHWPQEAARGLLRETINPLVRSASSGDYSTAGRYFARLMWTALAAPLGTEAINAVRTGIFGKQDENATWGEIWSMMLKHSPYLANALGQRLVNDVLAGPIWGTFGDVAMAAWNASHGNWQNIVAWDPTHPAVLSVMKGLGQLVQRATQERHIPSWKEIRDALRQSAVGPAQLWNAYENLGGPTPWSYMDKGYQDRDFARRSYTLWQKLTGQPLQPRQESVTAGLRTPYYNDISDALYSGDIKTANAVMQRMMKEQGESLKKAGTEIADSLNARAPIPSQNRQAFMQSAPEILEPKEMQRMSAIQQHYYQTALAAGLIRHLPRH